MAGSRWSRDKVSNNNPTHRLEYQILYPSKGCKYNLMPKSQSILLSYCITLYTVGTWNFTSVDAHRCLIFDNIKHFGICVTPECLQVSQSGCCTICLSTDVWCIRHALSLVPGSEIGILIWKKGKENPGVSVLFWGLLIYYAVSEWNADWVVKRLQWYLKCRTSPPWHVPLWWRFQFRVTDVSFFCALVRFLTMAALWPVYNMWDTLSSAWTAV